VILKSGALHIATELVDSSMKKTENQNDAQANTEEKNAHEYDVILAWNS